MDIDKDGFIQEAEKHLLPEQQAKDLWHALEQRKASDIPASNEQIGSIVTYYIGAFIVLFALLLLLSQIWLTVSHKALLMILIGYTGLFSFLGWRFSKMIVCKRLRDYFKCLLFALCQPSFTRFNKYLVYGVFRSRSRCH